MQKILSLVALLCCTWITDSQGALPLSEKKEARIGKEMYDKILAEMPVYGDQKLTAYVNDVGQRVAQHSDRPDLTYTFTVIDNPDINAFATPGGYIYIHRGLLTYMNSEAQLAAVLAHEIAHVTARHAARQKRAQTGSNVVAGLLAILTQSYEVGEASALWGAATVRGYGRDMELEADGLGAQFMARAGYDTEAMIEVIALLKDHERVAKKRARDAGAKPTTYHGLFATHPRNDKRLLEIINNADKNSASAGGKSNISEFRIASEGLVWGQNMEPAAAVENRFYHRRHGFQFDYPAGWQFVEDGNEIRGQSADRALTLTLQIKPRTTQSPQQFIKNTLGIPLLKKSEPFVQARMPGHRGLVAAHNNAPQRRLAVLYYGRGAFVFSGVARAGGAPLSEADDEIYMGIVHSFRPLSRRALAAQEGRRIHYVKALPGATYAELARRLNLGKNGEDDLRLINDAYPVGEPNAGQWIKIIR